MDDERTAVADSESAEPESGAAPMPECAKPVPELDPDAAAAAAAAAEIARTEAAQVQAARQRKQAIVREVKDYMQSIVLAVFLAMLIMTFIGRSFVVEGASMEPTLHNRERVIVEKISYRFTSPSRGDIIVLKNPWRPDPVGFGAAVEAMKELVDVTGRMRPYIKRVIALAGDTIEINAGVVFLNGKALDEPYIMEPPYYNYGPSVVPEGHVFVMGDNRNNSDDSRGSVGFLKISRIVGRAAVRYWPLARTTAFERPNVY
ncbi:MAG: signal peptidase I [Clostridia bacterium]|nr:signal peptidase I [Clostridia bacterium]